MLNIWNLIGQISVHISDTFYRYSANINLMSNERMLQAFSKYFETL